MGATQFKMYALLWLDVEIRRDGSDLRFVNDIIMAYKRITHATYLISSNEKKPLWKFY